MPRPRHSILAVAVAALLALVCAGALATPLATESARELGLAPYVRPTTDAEILGGRGLGADMPEQAQIRENQSRNVTDSQASWVQDQTRSYLDASGMGNPLDAFRSAINLAPYIPGPAGRSIRNRNAAAGGPAEGPLLGAEVQEWIDDAMRGIINSTLDFRINDQGRASFAVFGMGDFSVMVSGDRNEIALVAGDEVLTTAHRTPMSQQAVGYAGYQASDAYAGATSAGLATDPSRTSPLSQAMQLLSEIATHPLAMLVYALLAGYLILWNILSGRSDRQTSVARHAPPRDHPVHARRRTGRRSTHRSTIR